MTRTITAERFSEFRDSARNKEKGGSPEDARQKVNPMEAVAEAPAALKAARIIPSIDSPERKAGLWLDAIVGRSKTEGVIIYLELHPETAHGNPGVSRQVGDTQERAESDRFTAETAAATGKSERVVQRDAERGTKVIGEVIDMITGTKLDTGAYLDKLKRLSPNDQVMAARRDLAEQRRHDKPVKRAPSPQNAFEVKEAQIAALMTAWNKAGQEAREEFLSRIDTPVFDRKAGAA